MLMFKCVVVCEKLPPAFSRTALPDKQSGQDAVSCKYLIGANVYISFRVHICMYLLQHLNKRDLHVYVSKIVFVFTCKQKEKNTQLSGVL